MTPITFSKWPFILVFGNVSQVAKFQEKTNFFRDFRRCYA